jgi:release factor glutamine methyltransferase
MKVGPTDMAAVVSALRAAGCVFAEDEAAILVTEATTRAELDTMVARRAEGLPLEHVVGWARFCGRRIAVEPGVFVPRRRTALLVREAVALVGPGAVVVDLCCGSGALGVAVAAAVGTVELHACDLDPAAVRCARRNVEPVGGHVYDGDLDEPLPRTLLGRVGLLLANVPYVPSEEIALLPGEARLHEPRMALDGGGDGLDVFRRVVGVAPRWLAPGGSLLSETSERQVGAAVGILRAAGLTARVAEDDDLGATVVIGTVAPTSADVETPRSVPTHL